MNENGQMEEKKDLFTLNLAPGIIINEKNIIQCFLKIPYLFCIMLGIIFKITWASNLLLFILWTNVITYIIFIIIVLFKLEDKNLNLSSFKKDLNLLIMIESATDIILIFLCAASGWFVTAGGFSVLLILNFFRNIIDIEKIFLKIKQKGRNYY